MKFSTVLSCCFIRLRFVIVCLLTLTLQINAQKEQLRFKSLTTDNGLTNNFITCIIQDSYGFMWFGTDEGLNKFDGYELKVFKKKLNDTTSLADNHVSCIYTDSKKRLWIGTYNGLCLYNPDLDNFKTYKPLENNATFNNLIRVTAVFEDKEQNIYFNTENGILYKIENEKIKIVVVFQDYHYLKSCIIDKDGNFWFGDMKGILFYNPETGYLKNIQYFGSNGMTEKLSMVIALFEDGDFIWAGSNSGQLIKINKKSFEVQKYFKNNSTLNYIFTINKDNNNYLYVGSNEGLYVINLKNDKSDFYNHQPYDKDGLNASTVSYVYFDKINNLWLGTVQGGINYCIKGKKFSNYSLYSKPINLDLTSIECLLVDSKGNWWLGSYNKGINVINPVSGEKKLFLPEENNPFSLTRSSVTHIFEDSKNRIWTSTYYGHLQLYNPKTGQFVPFYFDHINNGYKEVTDIRSIVEDKKGNLWFISHGFGLFRFNPQTGQYKYFVRDLKNQKTSLSDDYAFQIVNQHDSILWIGTPTGVSKFNMANETFVNYFNTNDSTSLSHNYVNMVFIDSKENIWVGTFFGLNLLNRKTEKFYHYYENDGLPSNQIKSIIEEKQGRLWLATGEGITLLEVDFNKIVGGKPKIKFRNFTKSDNIQDKFYWERSVAKTPDGQFIFGSEDGVVAFYPSQIADNTSKPEVFITDFLLFNNIVKVGDFDSLLRNNIISTDKIILKHSQNIISFRYVAINYLSSEKNQYAYTLDGFDKHWNYVGNKREATYTNLDPGEYTFKVIASNNDGYWNKTGTSIKIIVLPPWWKTWWFRLLMIIIIISFAVLFYYIRFSFYKKQQKKLEEMVKERTLDLGETTIKLEERQEEINQQKEELQAQHEALFETNERLKEHQVQILEQNKELYKHRNELESLIEQRTHELIAAKEKAEESDRLKSSFLANLSHEIRTPLNAIMGFSHLVTEQDLSADEKSNYNQIIQNSGISLLCLIDDIIDFSKIESGHINIINKEVMLKKILDNINQIFDLQLKRQQRKSKKNIEFKVITDSNIDKLVLMTDEVRLNQILTNLINNAIKFTNKGSIEVGYRLIENNNMIEFYIKDTGIGIKKENHFIIFQRFRKVEETQTEIHRGAGLGLAITYQLVHLLGGTIYVDSEPSKGSTFFFTIPTSLKIRKQPYIKDDSHVSQVPDLNNSVIIIAEDDDSNFEYLQKLMQKANCQILRANDGKQVLSFLDNNEDIALILMDIKMPVLDGISTLKEIRKRQLIIPVLAQTAYALSDEVRILKEVGFDEYITKPIISSELYLKINKILKI